jgi:NitT/TauT family transport system substrate-binding protein
MDRGNVMNRSTLLTSAGAAAAAAVALPTRSSAQTLIPVRFALIGSGGQDEVSNVIQQFGLDKKYGVALEVIDFTAPGQQYPMFRADGADVAAGNFVDLLRQRKAGVGLRAFHGFQGYSNLVVTKPDSPIKTFADLKGKKVGEFGTTFLDWLILRAAGKKAHNVDLEKDAQLVAGSPPLLNQFLAKGDIDATLQFSSLTLGPIAQGQQRVVSEMSDLMGAAGFDPHCFYVQWHVTDKWTTAHPGAVDRVRAMLVDAYAKLKSDDSVWPPLAEKIHITDPALVAAYRDLDRKIDNPPYDPSLIAPTQKLLDAIVAIAGSDAVGVTTVDPAAFLFPGRRGR